MSAAPAIRNKIIARLAKPSRTKTEHLRKRLTTDRLARQNKHTQTTKFRDFGPISTREAITASSVADAPCGGNHLDESRFLNRTLDQKLKAFFITGLNLTIFVISAQF